MFNIAEGNANQNYNEVTPHTSENGYHQNGYKELMLKSVWRKENTVSGDVNCLALREHKMKVPKIIKNRSAV